VLSRLCALTLATGVILAPVASAAGVSSTATSPSRYPPGLGIRLVDAPVALKDDPRAHSYIIDRLAPGAVIHRRVAVSDGTDWPLQVSTYAAAARIAGGAFRLAPGRTQNEVSSWTSTRPGTLRLEPQHAAYVWVTIRVPKDAAPGERYGVIWAQTTIPPKTPGGIRQVSRVGVRMYLSIGPGNAPASDFHITSMTGSRDQDGLPIVRALVRNTGGRALDLTGDLRLADGPSGLAAGPFAVTLGTTLGIGQSAPVTVVLDKQVPDGPWTATISLESGTTKRSARATLTFPSGPGVGDTARANLDAGSDGFGLTGWAIGAALLLALLVLVAALVRSRTRRGPLAAG
jgi:hypothetical protein